MNPNNNQNNPNNNQNNQQRPFVDFNDPNLLNNAAFIHLIRQMHVGLQSSMPQPTPQMGFGNWNTPNENFGFCGVQDTPQQHFDRQQIAPTPPHSPDVEFVQETQPEVEVDPKEGGSRNPRKRRPHKKKASDEPRTRTPTIPWSPAEEMNLCKAWLEVTEDPREANYQKERTYWTRITDVFLRLEKKPAGYYDSDVVGAKWRKMRPQIQSFNQIYTCLTNANNHQSGANDADVVKAALRSTVERISRRLDFWEKLWYSSKFHYVVDFNAKETRGQPSAKRSKTSSDVDPSSQGSDARVNFDLNSLDDDEPVFEERVGGRDAARKAEQAGSSGSGGKGKGKARYLETFDNLTVKLEGLMDISKERVGMGKEKIELSKMKMKTKESEIKLQELTMLSNDYSNLPEPNRSIMMKAQQDIRGKYGYM